jgi:hypothetical protein
MRHPVMKWNSKQKARLGIWMICTKTDSVNVDAFLMKKTKTAQETAAETMGRFDEVACIAQTTNSGIRWQQASYSVNVE